VNALSAWRLLKLDTHNASLNMAIDEAILKARVSKLVPSTLRFYRWSPSAVSIGRFQKLEDQVLLENCRRLGIDVVRRITGGGSVYHDAKGEITYSVVASKRDIGAQDAASVYAKIYRGLAEVAGILGLAADFGEGDIRKCPNLTVGGRKISGSAQSHRRGVVLQHGTLLVNVDFRQMFTVLRVPWAKTCFEVMKAAESRITSVEMELGKVISTQRVNKALIEGFRRAFDVKLVEGELASEEIELAQQLDARKYSTVDWNFCGTNSV
jgi:lipoate-protein ligase A